MLLTEWPTKIDVAQVERVADVEHVLRVAVERRVALGVVRREVGLARADVVEQDDPVVVLERGRDEAPHVLVAAEAVGEQHRLRAARRNADVVAGDNGHERECQE